MQRIWNHGIGNYLGPILSIVAIELQAGPGACRSYMGIIGYRGNGKENGNYYSILRFYRDCIWVI